MVVGDDDQAVFRFRVGTVEALINFNHSCESHWGIDANSVVPVPFVRQFQVSSAGRGLV